MFSIFNKKKKDDKEVFDITERYLRSGTLVHGFDTDDLIFELTSHYFKNGHGGIWVTSSEKGEFIQNMLTNHAKQHEYENRLFINDFSESGHYENNVASKDLYDVYTKDSIILIVLSNDTIFNEMYVEKIINDTLRKYFSTSGMSENDLDNLTKIKSKLRPFIMDHKDFNSLPGTGVLTTQGRALGMAVFRFAEHVHSIYDNDEKMSILANTYNELFCKIHFLTSSKKYIFSNEHGTIEKSFGPKFIENVNKIKLNNK